MSDNYQKRKAASILIISRGVKHAVDTSVSTVVTARGGLDGAAMRRSVRSVG